MKKKIIVLLFIVIASLSTKVKALEMDSYIDWNLDRTVFAHKIQDGKEHINNLAMITANGTTAYCIEPGVDASKGSYYFSTTNINDTNLKNVNTKKLSLIGYYGYGYNGHNSREYYMAAQELIWREMGVESVWWTDAKEGGNTLNIDSYKDQIMSLVNNYEISPSFTFAKEYIIGDEINIEDKNGILKEYEVMGNQNVSINNNSINIKVKEGSNSFILRRKHNGKLTKFYYKNGYQTIGSFEFPYNYEKIYSINGVYGKIIINKLDSDTKSKKTASKYATLKGAVYGLYDSKNNLIKTEKTDENGNIVFDKLTKGEYIIKELGASTGYTVNKTITNVDLSTIQITVSTNCYETIIKNKIVVTKVLDDYEDKICVPEKDILFHVYDSFGSLVTEALTDENGRITLELPYGSYILRQMNAPDKIDKVKDRVIEVTEDGIVNDIILVNHKEKEPEPEPEPKIEQPPEIVEEELPDTGNNNILYYALLIPFSIIGSIYEKKRI